MINRLARWLAYEPVRTYLYGVFGAALVLCTGYGLLTDDKAFLWANLGAFVLVPAVEKARSRVKPEFRGAEDAERASR